MKNFFNDIFSKAELLFRNEDLALRIFTRIMLALTAVFFIYIGILSWVTRPVSDDFVFYAMARDYGFLGSLFEWYYNYQGRFTSQYLTAISAYYFMDFKYFYFLYNVPLTIAFGEGVYRLLKIFNRAAGIESDDLTMRLFGYFFMFGYIFFNGQSNIYFWLTCNQIYSLGIVAVVWGFVFLLGEKIGWKERVGALVCFAFVAGDNEAFSALSFLAVIFTAVVGQFTNENLKREKVLLIVLFLIFVGGLTILLGAPGNANRQLSVPVPKSAFEGFLISVKLIPFLWDDIKFKIFYGILFAFIFIPFGAMSNVKDKRISENILYVALLTFLPVAFLAFWGILFIVSVGTGTSAALRAYTVSYFIVFVHIALIFFLVGAVSDFGRRFGGWLGVKWALICLLFFSARTVVHTPKGLAYAKAYDERYEKMMQLKKEGFKGVAEFEPFPYKPDFIHVLELSTDINHEYNQRIKNCLLLGYDIKLKEQEQKD